MMECLPKSDYYEFRPDTLRNVRKLYGFDSADEMRRAVDVLESWVQKQQHFTKRDFSREYLEVTIIDAKGSVEKAKTRLDRLCTLRTLLPQFFGDFNVRTDFKIVYHEVMNACCLPKLTDDFYRVLLLKEMGNKYNGPLSVVTFQNILLLLELQKRLDYAVGQILFLDYTNADIVDIVTNINLVDLRNGFSIVQEGYGLRMKGIHILTTNKYIHMMVKVLQALFSPKLMSRLHIHEKMDTVYEFIPRELLPVEYGGTERSIDTLFEEFTALLSSEEQRAHVREMIAARTNEALRSKEVFNTQYLGLPGSFRGLTVD